MNNANNVIELVYENAINNHRNEIELVGLELEHASGVRATAAEQAMRERGGREHFDADLLFDAVDKLVGNDRLFESYNDPCNPNADKEEIELGQGCPFDSLDAYLDLRELLGDDWLVLAATEYAKRWENEGVNGDPRRKADEMVARAREEYAKARAADFMCFSERTKKRAA